MKKFVLKVVVVLSFGIMPFLGYAEVPGTMSYQGYLSDAQDRAFDGTTDITFSIPSTTWTEIHQGVPVKQGVFGVLLGSKNSLTGVDFSQAHSLRIEVNSVSQTVPLSSVPYALHAKTVELNSLSQCRICIYYADWNGNSGRKMICTKLVHGSDSGNMTLVGNVDDNDVLRMTFRCDGGPSGTWNDWNH